MIQNQDTIMRWSVTALALIAICPMVRGNFLLNGSFEDSTASIAPWVSGGPGAVVIFQNGNPGGIWPNAEDGNNYVALEGQGNTLSQTFNLSTGGNYQLTWWDNTGYEADNGPQWTSPYSVTVDSLVSQFDARVGGLEHPTTAWTEETLNLTLGMGSHTLVFTEETPNGGFTTLIDNVVLAQVQAVPEPTTLISGALLLLPFGSSAVRQIRKKLQAA